MTLLNKHLFYLLSYGVKKYDGRLWHLSEYYYITGCCFVGMTIAVEIWAVLNFIGFYLYLPLLSWLDIMAFAPLIIAIIVDYYMAKNRRCDKYYSEIDNHSKKWKGVMFAVQMVRIFAVYTVFFVSLTMIRHLNGG